MQRLATRNNVRIKSENSHLDYGVERVFIERGESAFLSVISPRGLLFNPRGVFPEYFPSISFPRILLSKMRGVLQCPRVFLSNTRGASEGCSSRVFLCNTSGVPRRMRESILASPRGTSDVAVTEGTSCYESVTVWNPPSLSVQGEGSFCPEKVTVVAAGGFEPSTLRV